MIVLGREEKAYWCGCRKCGYEFVHCEHKFLVDDHTWPILSCPNCGHKAASCFFDIGEYIEGEIK